MPATGKRNVSKVKQREGQQEWKVEEEGFTVLKLFVDEGGSDQGLLQCRLSVASLQVQHMLFTQGHNIHILIQSNTILLGLCISLYY